MNADYNDLFIRERMNELDDIFPKEVGDIDSLWEDINYRLDECKKKQRRWKQLAVAASVALIILTGIIVLRNPSSESVITYKTETVQKDESESALPDSRQEEKEALNYVNAQCQMEKPVCQSEEFIELKQQLNEVDTKLQEIEKQQKLFGADPALVKAQVAAENQKAYLLKELIQILRS